ncbi:PLD nuclease N-terminal domain-containing protein [Paenibacillus nasutitermitis]|uniref:Phosphatidylserine synthase n=1 Tax=Paenibacillus nasutitermitis TaxID=1652958 RepID=A0A916ZAN2_9BACL|nr:PLD nuclease N-terminal domain-containing protein [Paenibacillus nasutitermitis]GGD84711.1 phosphatidylserine synthase [Paenibacillus nasutitermitis]
MHIGYNIGFNELKDWLPLLLPLLILQLILIAVAMRDLLRSNHSKETKWIWAFVIVCVSLFGPVLYFVIGRRGQ